MSTVTMNLTESMAGTGKVYLPIVVGTTDEWGVLRIHLTAMEPPLIEEVQVSDFTYWLFFKQVEAIGNTAVSCAARLYPHTIHIQCEHRDEELAAELWKAHNPCYRTEYFVQDIPLIAAPELARGMRRLYQDIAADWLQRFLEQGDSSENHPHGEEDEVCSPQG